MFQFVTFSSLAFVCVCECVRVFEIHLDCRKKCGVVCLLKCVNSCAGLRVHVGVNVCLHMSMCFFECVGVYVIFVS